MSQYLLLNIRAAVGEAHLSAVAFALLVSATVSD